MPEGIEVEYYRRSAEAALGRAIRSVDAHDTWYLKAGTTAEELQAVLDGSSFTSARRRGKLLLLDTEDGNVIGLRFGMTGRLLIDDSAVIDHLEYSSDRDDPAWDRFAVHFDDGGALRLRDPRRLGGVELDPDEASLGTDLYGLSDRSLGRVLRSSARPIKARLLDQSQIAGLGNLLVDEILWRASVDPERAADSLTAAELRRLGRHLRSTVEQLTERGGSHTGDLHLARCRGGRCPRDGALLVRRTIGGRTTYSCPQHQVGEDKKHE